MPDFTRRVWYELTERGYAIDVRFGARVVRKERVAVGSPEECAMKVSELAERFKADEVREGEVLD